MTKNSHGRQGKEDGNGNLLRNPTRLSLDFSAETLQARREWNQIFKLLTARNHQTRIRYLAKLFFRYEGELKAFPDLQKLREFTVRHALQKMLKGTLLPETKRQRIENGIRWLTDRHKQEFTTLV